MTRSEVCMERVRFERMDIREVSGGLLVLGLLLSQEAGECNDISVNLLTLHRWVWVGRSHVCGLYLFGAVFMVLCLKVRFAGIVRWVYCVVV